MTVDIWSDIMCPFCYIGKRRLEQAIGRFEHKNGISVIWHSFQLDPAMEAQPGKSIYNYLAERKGLTRERSQQLHMQLVEMAKADGLTYNFDKAVIANSFDAHRLIQLAKTHGLGDEAEERLFRAYFTEGRDIGDQNTLQQLGMEIGLGAVETGEMLNSNAFADEVQRDIATASAYGINGVPFFVINDKYGISGAQPSGVFLDGLQQAWLEYERGSKLTEMSSAEGAVCATDGVCEPETINS